MNLFLLRHLVGSVASFWALALLGAPTVLISTYGFHLLFKKPFMTAGTKLQDDTIRTI